MPYGQTLKDEEKKHMRTGILMTTLSLTALGLLASACKPKPDQPTSVGSGIRYVGVKDGLNMRETPSPTGKKMLTIPHGSSVYKLEEKPEVFTIDKIDGKWTKVSYKNKMGWVFGGFLWHMPPPTSGAASDSGGDSAGESHSQEDTIPASARGNVWIRKAHAGEAIAFSENSYTESNCRGTNGENKLQNLSVSGDSFSGSVGSTQCTFSVDGDTLITNCIGGRDTYQRSSYSDLGDWANGDYCSRNR